MKSALFLFLTLFMSISYACETPFPREVVCGKVKKFQLKSKDGVTLKVEFEDAKIITFDSKEDFEVKSDPSKLNQARSVSVKGNLSELLLSNSSSTLSVAQAMGQSFCLDTQSVLSGEMTIVPMGKSNDLETALDLVIANWE